MLPSPECAGCCCGDATRREGGEREGKAGREERQGAEAQTPEWGARSDAEKETVLVAIPVLTQLAAQTVCLVELPSFSLDVLQSSASRAWLALCSALGSLSITFGGLVNNPPLLKPAQKVLFLAGLCSLSRAAPCPTAIRWEAQSGQAAARAKRQP